MILTSEQHGLGAGFPHQEACWWMGQDVWGLKGEGRGVHQHLLGKTNHSIVLSYQPLLQDVKAGLCLSGWAAKLKQKKQKDSKIEGINITAFIRLHKCLHVN